MPSLTFGVRQWVNLTLFGLRFYARHQVAIDLALATKPEVLAAMHTLLTAYNAIKSMNKPGPA
jgi:hypothetical protein